MNRSNQEQLMLTEGQANRLIGLFGQPLDQSTQSVAEPAVDEPRLGTEIIWYPMLTDLHEQVVHRLNPVLVDTRHLPGDSAPTLSLTLLGLPTPTVSNRMEERPLMATPVEQLPTPKPTL